MSKKALGWLAFCASAHHIHAPPPSYPLNLVFAVPALAVLRIQALEKGAAFDRKEAEIIRRSLGELPVAAGGGR